MTPTKHSNIRTRLVFSPVLLYRILSTSQDNNQGFQRASNQHSHLHIQLLQDMPQDSTMIGQKYHHSWAVLQPYLMDNPFSIALICLGRSNRCLNLCWQRTLTRLAPNLHPHHCIHHCQNLTVLPHQFRRRRRLCHEQFQKQ